MTDMTTVMRFDFTTGRWHPHTMPLAQWQKERHERGQAALADMRRDRSHWRALLGL